MERARQGSLTPLERVRLLRLEIDDFELIERASLEFAEGFTVCSGETGSGKTMLLGALDFVLGERASADVVRRGADRARVTLAFDPDARVRKRLADEGFGVDADEAAHVVREMQANGKSLGRINGVLATASQLRAFASDVLASIGQHEAQRLLSPAFALDALDGFAGSGARRLRADVRVAHERAARAARALVEDEDAARRALDELARARDAVADIDAVAPQADEDDVLRTRRAYLADGEKIRGALARAHETLAADGAGSAVEALGAAATSLAGVARYANSLGALAQTLAALQSDAQDAAVALARELEASDFDPSELDAVSARLDALERLKKKFGGSLASVAAARAEFAAVLERDGSREERQAAQSAEFDAARAELALAASELSRVRVDAARALEARVATELAALAMPAARFAVALEPLAEPGPTGAESAAFALSPNPGEPLRPLVRAASGGELSRVLLALVVATAERREPTALVFDEIDAGIGGATAAAVGTRLGALARGTQVLAVTHLAQIASWADRHYALRKRERAGATIVELVLLEERPAVVAEIARMLSGTAAAVALEHAETLVREVRARKAGTKLRT